MKYIELKIHASRQGIEQITAMLLQRGIDQVSINDPEDVEDILNKKHEYGWDYIEDELKENLDREPTISVFFEDNEADRALITDIKNEIEAIRENVLEGAYGGEADFGTLKSEEIVTDDSEWKDRWKEFFKPTRITERLVVKPSWEKYESADGELVIEIDPGMAFGTGTHETTSLCMKLMEKYMGVGSESIKVMDVGCGSGILSIAAALLGSKQILGVEIDEDAVNVARENAELNGVSDQVNVIQGDLTKGIDFRADLIVANLMADLVMMLAESAGEHLYDNGIFISSGILMEKKEKVALAIENAGFVLEEIAEDGEWCAIAARRKQEK